MKQGTKEKQRIRKETGRPSMNFKQKKERANTEGSAKIYKLAEKRKKESFSYRKRRSGKTFNRNMKRSGNILWTTIEVVDAP